MPVTVHDVSSRNDWGQPMSYLTLSGVLGTCCEMEGEIPFIWWCVWVCVLRPHATTSHSACYKNKWALDSAWGCNLHFAEALGQLLSISWGGWHCVDRNPFNPGQVTKFRYKYWCYWWPFALKTFTFVYDCLWTHTLNKLTFWPILMGYPHS